MKKKTPASNETVLPPLGTCFLVYAQDGEEYAQRLRRFMEAAGASILRPMDISAGSRWVEAVAELMWQADVTVVIWSPAASNSEWIKRAVVFCREQGTPVFPIVFPDATHTVPSQLRDIQWLAEESVAKGPSRRAQRELENVLRLHAGKTSRADRQRLRIPPRLQPSGKRTLNEGKLILVGRGEVGKTSLVRRLVENGFDGNESKTQGIRITSWVLPRGEDRLRLNIWDFGGQEMMHATHQFFLTERSLYLLVLNGRTGAEDLDAEYWLKHIESFGGESPVIVVQNKIAQHPFELNYRGLRGRYPQIRGFAKTDCQDETGLRDLRQLIESAIDGMPEVRMSFPADWFTVKEQLESMRDDYLGYQGFVELCAEQGIEGDADRETLSVVLHCLGIALNFRDDARLRETSVLKPEWVTQGIYAILNAKQIADRQGELRLSDLAETLPKERYPREKHLFLVELMRKFSLCFPFPDDTERFLVPELLGKEEPEAVATFPPEECLNFEYHYGVMPEGLVPRFIVRTHPLSRNRARWRSGVVLAFEGCTALVKAEPGDRRVVIRVRGGDASGRRRLLAIIRCDLERIHSDFKDRLDAKAKVPLMGSPASSIDYDTLVAFEKQGIQEFPALIGQRVVSVNVRELLNGVDFDEQRKDPLETLNRARSVFFSYSHKDEALRDELETHLKLLQRQGIISTWHDRRILPGEEWDGEIDDRLERAAIVLLLVSADFLASNYCWEMEVKRAMERHAARDAIVVPVMLRTCDWKSAPFAKLQGLPRDMRPVTAWSDRDAAWTDVAAGIRAIAERGVLSREAAVADTR